VVLVTFAAHVAVANGERSVPYTLVLSVPLRDISITATLQAETTNALARVGNVSIESLTLVRQWIHTEKNPRKAFVQSPKNDKTLILEYKVSLHDFEIHTLKNVSSEIFTIVRFVERKQGSNDSTWIAWVIFGFVLIFLPCLACFIWIFTVFVKRRRANAVEKRVAEKFGETYKRHLGVRD
jgi:hypothetical protein